VIPDPHQRPKVGAIAVVLHEGAALMVQRGKAPNAGLWGFPGGHVEWGETALEAAVRELAEETGVTATATGYLTCLDVLGRDAEDRLIHHYLLAAVLCDYVAGSPVAADDAAAAAWVPLSEIAADGRPFSRNVDRVIAAAQAAQRPSGAV
jgi:ADP-ribose pyrophosphatase YjhB (NUDIX family)